MWPWAYLQSIESQHTIDWIELREEIPTIHNLNGISSEHDIRNTFKDMYVDLSMDMQYSTELSMRCDLPYLS